MTALSVTAALQLALQCSAVAIDPHLVLAHAQQESGLDPAVIHTNRNGTRDFGLMQINETNFGLLHLTPLTALDPCQSIRAETQLMAILSRYNSGSPTRSIGYAVQVMARLHAVDNTAAPAPKPSFTEAPSDALAEPTQQKGANGILVFDGWEGD